MYFDQTVTYLGIWKTHFRPFKNDTLYDEMIVSLLSENVTPFERGGEKPFHSYGFTSTALAVVKQNSHSGSLKLTNLLIRINGALKSLSLQRQYLDFFPFSAICILSPKPRQPNNVLPFLQLFDTFWVALSSSEQGAVCLFWGFALG